MGILKNCIKIYNSHYIDEYFQHFKLEQSKCKKIVHVIYCELWLTFQRRPKKQKRIVTKKQHFVQI
jgi:hypothetical protein